VFKWGKEDVLTPDNGTITSMPTWGQREFKSFCQGESLLVLFDRYTPDQLEFDKALSFCRSLGGQMAMPSSLEEERGRWKDLMFGSLTPRYFQWRFIFLPVTDQNNGTFVNVITGEKPAYTNWDLQEPNGGIAENCSALTMCDPAVW
jgi:hypothetical protein